MRRAVVLLAVSLVARPVSARETQERVLRALAKTPTGQRAEREASRETGRRRWRIASGMMDGFALTGVAVAAKFGADVVDKLARPSEDPFMWAAQISALGLTANLSARVTLSALAELRGKARWRSHATHAAVLASGLNDPRLRVALERVPAGVLRADLSAVQSQISVHQRRKGRLEARLAELDGEIGRHTRFLQGQQKIAKVLGELGHPPVAPPVVPDRRLKRLNARRERADRELRAETARHAKWQGIETSLRKFSAVAGPSEQDHHDPGGDEHHGEEQVDDRIHRGAR